MRETTQSQIIMKKNRQWTTEADFDEALNLVRNTLKCNEAEAMTLAGYSGASPAARWRKDSRYPLIAVNALKGLLADRQIVAQNSDRRPLAMTSPELETVLQALTLLPTDPNTKRIRAGIHR